MENNQTTGLIPYLSLYLLLAKTKETKMITLQSIHISWTKEARGGKLVAIRNGIPHAFEIAFERKSQRLENYIHFQYSSSQRDDTVISNKSKGIFDMYFELENGSLLITKPKYNGYDRKIALLHHNESIQFIEFDITVDFDFRRTYHKTIINLVYTEEPVPSDYFLNHAFDYRFDEKSDIWKRMI